MSDDLPRRLRCISPVASAKNIFDTMKETAAEIERLNTVAGYLKAQEKMQRTRATAAEAEAARLREALTDLVDEVEEYELGNPDTLRRARAALGGQP
jgi:regulator of replication initiation timing